MQVVLERKKGWLSSSWVTLGKAELRLSERSPLHHSCIWLHALSDCFGKKKNGYGWDCSRSELLTKVEQRATLELLSADRGKATGAKIEVLVKLRRPLQVRASSYS